MEIELIEGDGAGARTSTRSFYDNLATDGAAYGKLKREISPSGSWVDWHYDTEGRIHKRVSQFLATAPGSAENLNRMTTWTYATVADLDDDTEDELLETEIDTLLGQEIARRYRLELTATGVTGATAWKETRDIVTTVAGAAWDAPTNLVTLTRTGQAARLKDRVIWSQTPDGTVSTLEFEILAAPGGGRKWTTRSGILSSDGAILGRRVETIEDTLGREIHRDVYESGLLIDSVTVTERDSLGRPVETVFFDGSQEHRQYACCGLSQFRGRDGVLTVYEHDHLGRVERETTGGITLAHTHDAADRRIKTVRIGTDDSEITLFESTYNTAGRLLTQTDARGRVTTHEEEILVNGQTERRVLHADGSEIRRHHPDGSLLSVRGTAAVWSDHAYGVDADGYFEQKFFPRGDEGATPAVQWTKRYHDQAGRPHLTRHADDAEERTTYDGAGEPASSTDPDGVRTLYLSGHDEVSGQVHAWSVTALDVNRNGEIDYAAAGPSADRITRTTAFFTLRGGIPVRRTRVEQWQTDGDTPAEISITDAAPNGLETWSTHHGLTTHTLIVHDGLGGGVATTTFPDQTSQIRTTSNNRLVSDLRKDATGATMLGLFYAHDAHGRVEASTHSGHGATTYTWFDDDQIDTITTPDPDASRDGEGYDRQTTSHAYDNRGRVAIVTHPDATQSFTTYWPTGAVRRTWGSRTYPSEYTQDAQGRMKTLTTWRDFAGEAGAAVTTWNYHTQRGWLLGKRHADDQGPSYTYSPAGRLLTRAWARGVTTTYGHTDAGDLASIAYSDTTPGVAHIRDRTGRLLATTDAAGTLIRAYENDRLAAEVYTGTGLLAGRSVTRVHDNLHRTRALSVPGVYSVGYTHDAAGRLATVAQDFHLASYGYKANVGTVESMTLRRVGVERVKHTRVTDDLGRTIQVKSASGATIHVQRDYAHNDANQRTEVIIEEAQGWVYGYDDLGQVISAQKRLNDPAETPLPGHDFGYAFDSIGNRSATTVNGRAAAYALDADGLNQYVARVIPGALDVRGEARADSTVTVNTLSTSRTGKDFYRELGAANGSAAISTSVTVEATLAGSPPVTATEVRDAFLARTPEIFTHDADGNLIADGRWTYTWDAENRLVRMETQQAVVDLFPALRERLEFAYDAQGRRIQKRVLVPAGGAGWSVAKDIRFVYDGWNLLLELDALNDMAVVRSHVWGLDLSGSMQGAGGVGGLLWTNATLPIPGSALPVSYTFAGSSDANGNIVAWINTATLAVSGRADYGAFGERVQQTGVVATLPFGFSSKYRDTETDYVYYGFRYYNPSTGRWPNRDPLWEAGGINLYGMVGNDAVNGYDLFGLAKEYKGCFTPNQLKFVKAAEDEAKRLMPPAVKEFGALNLKALFWANEKIRSVNPPGFGLQIDDLGRSALKHLNLISGDLTGNTYTMVCGSRGAAKETCENNDWDAFASYGSRTITICDQFYDLDKRTAAGIVVHELSHAHSDLMTLHRNEVVGHRTLTNLEQWPFYAEFPQDVMLNGAASVVQAIIKDVEYMMNRRDEKK